jgi:hypothetical protein
MFIVNNSNLDEVNLNSNNIKMNAKNTTLSPVKRVKVISMKNEGNEVINIINLFNFIYS